MAEVTGYVVHVLGSDKAADRSFREEGIRQIINGDYRDAQEFALTWLEAGDHVGSVRIMRMIEEELDTLTQGDLIIANRYPGLPLEEARRAWRRTQRAWETGTARSRDL